MSLFEGLSKVISETSATAVSKTKELARIAQLNGAISDEEKIIAAAHTEIGRRYMENLAGERPDLFGDQVERIREAQSRIEALRRELEEVKGMGKCPYCGAQVEAGKAFCGSCGARLPQPEAAGGTPQNTES
ncbi:zinc-ribbon domain-containing protein [Candidatus Allofournierella excrementigallinarum]|uniref:zinc ribbon domain-containing protein n=1 Tax=Candidatus Allofournierella excrementigallinarum TaxID=2838592 RepID=UPI001FA4BFC3|nr:zinc-ribbon domain-containing protein [Candidatus Fournierella merdigallinarum]